MDRWQSMRVFVKVAERSGFAEAARQLRMSPPAVTRAVSSLEELIGARLLVRTTRSVNLTEAGHRYLEDCRRILADVAEAEAAATGSFTTPSGTLILTAPVLFGRIYALPILMKYLGLYPSVAAQTLFLDRVVNLVDEGIDVAIRIGRLPDSDLTAARVGSVSRVVCAAPSYLMKHGEPAKPADLATHSVVAVTNASTSTEWRFGDRSVVVHPRLCCNLDEAAIAAAIEGWGLTRALSYQVGPAIADGRLRKVLADFEEEPLPIHVVHAGGRTPSAKVRSFVDFAAACLRANEILN